jgi:hypothetical protein
MCGTSGPRSGTLAPRAGQGHWSRDRRPKNGLILALTAGGITKTDAAAVFVQRLFSACLPPIAGWITFMWMRRREYL